MSVFTHKQRYSSLDYITYPATHTHTYSVATLSLSSFVRLRMCSNFIYVFCSLSFTLLLCINPPFLPLLLCCAFFFLTFATCFAIFLYVCLSPSRAHSIPCFHLIFRIFVMLLMVLLKNPHSLIYRHRLLQYNPKRTKMGKVEEETAAAAAAATAVAIVTLKRFKLKLTLS